MIKNAINKLLEFFQDGTGSLSAMRLLLIVWGIGTFVIWSILCIKGGNLVPIPLSILSFISSLVAGKCIQNVTERDINVNTTGNATVAPAVTVNDGGQPH